MTGDEKLDVPPEFTRRGVSTMMTYGEFFQFCLVVIGIIGLVMANKKK